MSLHHLMYVSHATQLLTPEPLRALLTQSRALNQRDDLTGILIYSGGAFIQILEGRHDPVHTAYARIQRDPRHQRVRILLDEPLEAREFGQWQMFCPQMDTPDLYQASELCRALLKSPVTDDPLQDLGKVRRLLSLFCLKAP